jgi:malate dehydrogenase (oxaloacetate-decarboxylating)(NADP+)
MQRKPFGFLLFGFAQDRRTLRCMDIPTEREAALQYHSEGRPGKIEVVPTKPTATQRDLSLAYSPGVAEPCREIAKNRALVSKYTARQNLVGVISNGTAVLGLGNIGPYAAKPVMEGKAMLFKKFADIDVFDIEIDADEPDAFIETVARMEPTFGGINLEDVRAPECFRIENELKARMKIPVFHDDQHGTAIITAAALLNACEVLGKKVSEVRVVCNGAGASAIRCMELWVAVGLRRENIMLLDTKGVVHGKRTDLSAEKARFVRDVEARTLADAMRGADVFVGLSVGNVVSAEMLKSMAERPLVFALANPDPEVPYHIAREARPDALVATGRSDHPNQVNNVLGFPGIFRGALDVGAREINEAMKLASVYAIAKLAKEPVPKDVLDAYGLTSLAFGAEYIIPKPVDMRVVPWVATAVAKAAMDTGVAMAPVDLETYRASVHKRLLG